MERWLAKVKKTQSCWVWVGSLDRKGYGQFDVNDENGHRNHRAHRWGYQHLVRELADDEPLDHLCRNHACVNPDHLEPVTHAENVARGVAGQQFSSRTHCSYGHEYTPENTRVNERGWRTCLTCQRRRNLEGSRKARGYQGNPPNGEKTHCKNGHEFTPENTAKQKTGRICITCRQAYMRDYRQRRRAAQD